MKKYIIAVFIVFGFCVKSSNAQNTQVTDTLQYLQLIVSNKTQYVGQPFSKLLDSLQIQIKHFSPFSANSYDISKETSTSFSFYYPNTIDDFYLTYPKLEIVWQLPLNAIQSDALWENNNGGGWSPVVKNFYAVGIIADIKVRE